MDGDGMWRTQCVGDGPRPFVVWRIVNGQTEYYRTAPCNYGPRGRIMRLSYDSARKRPGNSTMQQVSRPRSERFMGHQRPWKVHFHHDGTKTFVDSEATPDVYVIDTSRPIDGTSAHADEGTATAAARRVSRNGGHALVTRRDPATGIETEIRAFAPYEVALDDLVDSTNAP